MNDYIQVNYNKDVETRDLWYFIDEYEYRTGVTMDLVEVRERPDFICDVDGTLVGVELNQIRRDDLALISWDTIVERKEWMDPYDALYRIQTQAIEKDKKRKCDDWELSDNTILVLQLTDIPLDDLQPFLRPENLTDLQELGFSEVWIADYTGIEAFDDVELFGVYPTEIWGYYKRPLRKPYG